jgi:hypothetical protein
MNTCSFCRVTYVRILKAWKDGMRIVRYEKKRTQHKAEAWTKIHFWLDEHKEVCVCSRISSPPLASDFEVS